MFSIICLFQELQRITNILKGDKAAKEEEEEEEEEDSKNKGTKNPEQKKSKKQYVYLLCTK